MSYHVYIDGASRGNPGHAAIGVFIADENGKTISRISKYIGHATNNQAEYKALIAALEYLKNKKDKIIIHTDSQLLERQWKRIYRVKNPDIQELYYLASKLAHGLNISVVHVEREKNKEADALANKALDEQCRGEHRSPVCRGGVTPPIGRESGDRSQGSRGRGGRSLPLRKRGCPPFGQDAKTSVGADPRVCPKPGPDDESDFAETQSSAGGVVYKFEGKKVKILLISKKGGSIWAFPKGRIEEGEDPEKTAEREILEETGYRCAVKSKLEEIEYSFLFKEEGTFYNKKVIFYLMPIISDIQHPRDAEAEDVRWFTVGDAIKKITHLSEKKILEKARGLLE